MMSTSRGQAFRQYVVPLALLYIWQHRSKCRSNRMRLTTTALDQRSVYQPLTILARKMGK